MSIIPDADAPLHEAYIMALKAAFHRGSKRPEGIGMCDSDHCSRMVKSIDAMTPFEQRCLWPQVEPYLPDLIPEMFRKDGNQVKWKTA